MTSEMKFLKYLLVLSFLFLPPLDTYALKLEAIEFLSGYLEADLMPRSYEGQRQDDYRGVPLLVSFDFDGKPLLDKFRIDLEGKFNLIVEPFLNTIFMPETDIEVGSNFLIKYRLTLIKKFQPYFKGGIGMLYMSHHAVNQSTQYNFLPQIGGGVHFFLNENRALNLEYRFRHLSNAGLQQPNRGIETHLFLAGVSIFF